MIPYFFVFASVSDNVGVDDTYFITLLTVSRYYGNLSLVVLVVIPRITGDKVCHCLKGIDRC